MKTHLKHIVAVIGMATAIAVGSCGNESLVRVDRPPIVRLFAPTDTAIDAVIGDTLRFSVSVVDLDHDDLDVRYSINDSVVAHSYAWTYVVEGQGSVPVHFRVTDGELASQLTWRVHQSHPVNFPPRLTGLFPVEANPTMVVDTDQQFAVDAEDRDGDTLSYSYSIDGVDVSAGPRYTFHPTTKGTRMVRAVVSDGENTVAHDWNVRVTGIPDSIAPAIVQITAIGEGTEPGEVDIEWITVGKDGMVGVASNYLVRTSPTPIRDEADWSRASERPGVPSPLPAGQTMRMTIRNITPARHTYVAVRAVDDFGNLSPISAPAETFSRGMWISGRVLDALTMQPIAGAIVRFLSREDTTSTDGSWQLTELSPEISTLVAMDEDERLVIGSYFDYGVLYAAKQLDDLNLYLIPAVRMESTMYPDFLVFFRSMTDTPGIPVGSSQRRWNLPVDFYVPSFSKGGLDYAAVITSVAAELDQDIGQSVFHLVSATPAVGVDIRYRTDITRDNFLMRFWTAQWYPQDGRIEHRQVYTAASELALRNISRHEIGHALGLNHSIDPIHVMVGGVAPTATRFTSDEVDVLRVRYHLPRGLDNAGFRED